MGFSIPECADSDSWGPPADAVDADKALIYAPFTRSDKFGRGTCTAQPEPYGFAQPSGNLF